MPLKYIEWGKSEEARFNVRFNLRKGGGGGVGREPVAEKAMKTFKRV